MAAKERGAEPHGGTEWFEIERKYEVHSNDAFPTDYSGAGFTASAPETHELVASYYDTPARALAERRLALRHRIGGSDAGWHLKERGADGTKELSWPGSATIPDGVIDLLRSRIGDAVEHLSPIATLRVTRTVVALSEGDADVIEMVDDVVHSFDHIAEVERSWREWEAELRPGADPAVLERIEPILAAAGAARSLSASKISRTLGMNLAFAEEHGGTPRELASLAIADVADRLSAHERFDEGDVALLRRLARSVLD